MRIPFAVVLLILISFVFNVKSQNLSERLGVCTSPDKALLLKDAGYAYIEIGIRSFLMPDKPDSLFAFNLQQAVIMNINNNNFFMIEILMPTKLLKIIQPIKSCFCFLCVQMDLK